MMKSMNKSRDLMKYREDMMKIVAECLGMCSDRPGITPNTLDLEVSPTCLRERELWLLDEVCAVWWGE